MNEWVSERSVPTFRSHLSAALVPCRPLFLSLSLTHSLTHSMSHSMTYSLTTDDR